MYEAVIVLGDLNTLPGSPPILTLGMADAVRDSTAELERMGCRSHRTAMISSPKRLEVISGTVDFVTTDLGRPASDHWPIRAVLRAPRRPF